MGEVMRSREKPAERTNFGPIAATAVFSLFWKRTTLKGAVAGVFFGGSTVLLWKECFAYTGLYEIIPGFAVSCLAIFIVSLLDKQPSASIIKDFEATEQHINDL